MVAVKLRVLNGAEDELYDAARWYEKLQSGAGEELVAEYRNAVLRIQAAPETLARVETTRSRRNLRRCLLHRFPYYIPFELRENEIVILAVAHAKRRPNYWIRRR